MKTIPETDYLVLTALSHKEAPQLVLELAAELGQDQAKVTASCLTLRDSGEVRVDEQEVCELRLGPKARDLPHVLPERAVIKALSQVGSAEIPKLAELADMTPKEVGQALRWLKDKGWAKQDKKLLVSQLAPGEEPPHGADEQLFQCLMAKQRWVPEADVGGELELQQALAQFARRKGFVDVRQKTRRLVSLTAAGRAMVEQGIQYRQQVNQLSPELLVSGQWRDVDLRPYDVTLRSEPLTPGKEHPLQTIFQQTRRVFLEMGFSETTSPYVESSFWDFDALFQPQDHPARDMQDTFYVSRPQTSELPDDEVVDAVRRTHEDGGDTGSVGWRYRWSRQQASRPVLRTHTTAATARALAEDPNPPRKVFCVGPVFRRETVDYKHLPIFHQVDGIIIDEQASFASLLGTLSAFYRKMGFTRFHFQPAFYPYTEPSVDVFVWAEAKKDWVEMGGAGVFRPEVTRPLGCEVPVLAWGLGMERLAMFRYGLPNLSELYRARLGWLKETPLCR